MALLPGEYIALRKELSELLGTINEQIKDTLARAEQLNVPNPRLVRNSYGDYILSDLLLAKSNTLLALVSLKKE